MARYDDRRMAGPRYRGDRDYDQDRRDMRYAYGRYSGAPSTDDRYRRERDPDRDYDYGDPGYDPDHAYRSRRYRGHDDVAERPDREQPYADRPYPGEYGDRRHGAANRGMSRRWDRSEEEEAWRRPSAWFGTDTGPYRGVGPKGYMRSDERIREHVCDALTDDPHLNAVEIEVVVTQGEVTLSGNVDSRGAKRHAEDLAEQASGVKQVQNNLRVADGRREGASSGRGDSSSGREKGATH
jgi:hypothetical protein